LAQLGLNLGYLIVQIICFFIIFVVVRVWIVKPLQGLLERRRATIAKGLEDARFAEDARAHGEKEAAETLAEARIAAAHIVADATERADAAAVEVRANAEKEIVREREATLTEVEEERARMLGDLRGQVAALAIAAAQKLVGEALSEKRQRELLAEFFSGVKSGKVVLLEGVELSGASAEVTSALPLTADEQTQVKKDVLARMGKQATIAFRVDPTILGGLVIRVGDKVLDDSVAGKLEGLRQNLH
jgi:F-type H+-transporting ATPase subunit b